VAYPAQNLFFGAKILDFGLATVFCMGYCLSKHEMTRNSKHFWGHGPVSPPLATPMATAATQQNVNQLIDTDKRIVPQLLFSLIFAA